MPQVVTISFYRFNSVAGRLWALTMMGAARWPLARVPGIGFWKLCGSGGGEGFTPRLNIDVIAILATWPNTQMAQSAMSEAKIFKRYAAKSDENWTVYLSTDSVRGQWAGQAPFIVSHTGDNGPIAVLTRATIKPSILPRFWRRVPNISDRIGADPLVMFKIGLGEMPLFQQVTFSIWPNIAALTNFARTGAHAAAIKAVRDENWFREELYARFTLLSEDGTWGDSSPLARLENA